MIIRIIMVASRRFLTTLTVQILAAPAPVTENYSYLLSHFGLNILDLLGNISHYGCFRV